MQVNKFYQTNSENTLLLSLLTKAEIESGLEAHSVFEVNCLHSHQFKGRLGDVCVINDNEGKATKVYIGAGDGVESLAIAHALARLPAGSYLPQQPLSKEALLVWSLAQYRFNVYKSHDVALRVLVLNEKELEPVVAEAAAIFLVRDLINTPANDLSPADLAKIVSQLAETHNAVFQQWVDDELLTQNFPAIHAVGRAAAAGPRLLSLVWGEAHHPKVTLVGKGVCFDSGGLDIKPSAAMRLMKKDMGGAAHVIGLAQWIMTRRLPIHLTILIPAVENAVGPQSFRPGDILTMRNGLKVEVDNTDAEGRLILADALVKACEDQPELLIDFSTLTGAARVAVGTEIAAMFTNEEALAQEFSRISAEIRDPVWHMPLYAGYNSYLESPIADLMNSSPSPYAGAIIAALFLQRFIKPALPWIHFDVMGWNVNSRPGKPEGGEAMGLRTVAHYLLQKYG